MADSTLRFLHIPGDHTAAHGIEAKVVSLIERRDSTDESAAIGIKD